MLMGEIAVSRLNGTATILLSVILCSVIISCSPDDRDSYQKIDVLRVGVLPDATKRHCGSTYTPLINYLADQIDLPVKLIIPDSYAHLLELFLPNKSTWRFSGGQRSSKRTTNLMRSRWSCAMWI